MSLIESIINIGSGFVIATLCWHYVIGPVYGIHKPILENMSITFWFTVISVIRSYLWRRYFNLKLIEHD